MQVLTTLGWLILVGGIAAAIWVLRARAAAAEAAGRAGAPPAPTRAQYGGVIAALVVGIWLIAAGNVASARLIETHTWDFSSDPQQGAAERQWLINNTSAVSWDQPGGRLKFHLEASDGGIYAVAPVDWNADAFRAEWDIQIDHLRNSSHGTGVDKVVDRPVVGIGLFDGSLADIEDVDHVGGSTIQASFGNPDKSGNDLYLRVSDVNLLVKSDYTTSPQRQGAPIQLQLGQTYHAVLAYNRRDQAVTLEVSPAGSNQPIARLKVDDLRDFTPNVAYFGLSTKGYKKGKDDKPKPVVDGWIDNVRFFQP